MKRKKTMTTANLACRMNHDIITYHLGVLAIKYFQRKNVWTDLLGYCMREPFIIEWHFELEMLISRKWKKATAMLWLQ